MRPVSIVAKILVPLDGHYGHIHCMHRNSQYCNSIRGKNFHIKLVLS